MRRDEDPHTGADEACEQGSHLGLGGGMELRLDLVDDERVSGLEASAQLSDSPRQLVGRFLCSESPSLAEAALEMLEADRSLELPEECEQLLASDSQRVRLGLAGILVGRWNQNKTRIECGAC